MPSADELLWNEPTAGHAQLRRAYVLLDRTRVLTLALAAGWILHLHLTMSPQVEPDAIRFVSLSGVVAALGITTWFGIRFAPLGAGIALAIAGAIHGEVLAGFGLRTPLSIGLAVFGGLLLAPLGRARLLLIGPTAMAGLHRFDRRTRANRFRRMQRSFAGALLVLLAIVTWHGFASYEKGRIPKTLEPTIAEFTAAWNDTQDDAPLRRIIDHSGPNAWSELVTDLSTTGQPTTRPTITEQLTVRAYDTNTTVEFSLADGRDLKTYWELKANEWVLDFWRVTD